MEFVPQKNFVGVNSVLESTSVYFEYTQNLKKRKWNTNALHMI